MIWSYNLANYMKNALDWMLIQNSTIIREIAGLALNLLYPLSWIYYIFFYEPRLILPDARTHLFWCPPAFGPICASALNLIVIYDVPARRPANAKSHERQAAVTLLRLFIMLSCSCAVLVTG